MLQAKKFTLHLEHNAHYTQNKSHYTHPGGLWCVVGGAGYLYLGLTALPMPSHKEEEQKELQVQEQGLQVKEQGLEVQCERPGLLLLLLFLYYTASGAVERTFQSMATTW